MDRPKMSLNNRAKQFLPFDAMKGLQAALRMKEYEMTKEGKFSISEDEAKKISDTLASLQKEDVVALCYYEDGHYQTYVGHIKVEVEYRRVLLDKKPIPLNSVKEISVLDVDEAVYFD